MAKNVKKDEPTKSTIKSKKPRMPGINSTKDTNKGFRIHAFKGMLKGVVGPRKIHMIQSEE